MSMTAAARVRRATAMRAVAVGGAGALVALAFVIGTWRRAPYSWWAWGPIQAAGLSFLLSGTVLWLRRPVNGTGRLMIAVGVAWYLGELQLFTQPVAYAIGFCLFYLHTAVMAQLVLSLPGGRLRRPSERWLVVVLYAAPVATQVPRLVAEYPPEPQAWGRADSALSIWAPVGSVVMLVSAAVVVVILARRWVRAGAAARREYLLVWCTVVAMGVVVGVTAFAAVVIRSRGLLQVLVAVYATGLIAFPVAVAAGIMRVRLARLRVAELVVTLATATEPEELRRAVARALGDPVLQIWYSRPGGYVDSAGSPLVTTPDRLLRPVGPPDEPIAVLALDPDLATQDSLVDAVVAASRLALDNARLVAGQRAALTEVRDSRTRLVVAADDERRRIQRDLHDGLQHDLLALSMLVQRAQAMLAADRAPTAELGLVARRLPEVVQDLRRLTEGIHPAALTEQGLAAALETLAERAPMPLIVNVVGGRWPESVERVAYFVVAEALANVYKHAQAGHARVDIVERSGRLVVSVADDGTGGADSQPGGGLSGLQDRVAAVAGSMHVASSSGGGTTIVAELPCG